MIFEINDLKKTYGLRKNGLFSKSDSVIKAVDGVSFNINENEILGLVGESGSGKSTIGKILIAIENYDSGSVKYKSKELKNFDKTDWQNFRKECQFIFQDPYSSLNPRQTVYSLLKEAITVNNIINKKDNDLIDKKIRSLIDSVGLEENSLKKYPHEFSGGQRQRIVIARALSVNPKFIVADEPVSALDVSVQAQILNLINDLKEECNLSILFVSHDLSVVQYLSDRILVMNSGKIVESGITAEVYNNPQHEYTKKLLNAEVRF